MKNLSKELEAVKKIIIDSDMDGVMCGAILRNVFPDAQIFQSKATEIQEGRIDHLIDKSTLMADLRYSPLAGFYFDHHESNKPTTEFVGSWKPYDSAAHVIYEYFKDYADLSKFEKLLPDMDLFDAGKLTIEDFRNPSKLVQLALVVNRDDKDFNLKLVEDLAKKDFEEVFQQENIQARIKKYQEVKSSLLEYCVNHSEVDSEIVYVDLRQFKSDEKMASFVFTSYFEDADMIVVLKKHRKEGFVKVRFYRNNFFKTDSDLDLLKIAMIISPETGGGHKGACGFNISEDRIDEMKRIVREELDKQE